MDARLIIDEPAQGSWNMAVDEALFSATREFAAPILRLYRWSVPTLSLGYFQSALSRNQHLPSRDIPLVRRSTGGGAIVHDRELTYSLVLDLDDTSPAAARGLMTAVHRSLIELLSEMQIPASSASKEDKASDHAEPFLCFQRRTSGDILLQGHKVVGSAQRRQRSRLLQHGSILVSRSSHAPELPGIQDLAGSDPIETVICAEWPERIRRLLKVRWLPSSLTSGEREAAKKLVQGKFEADSWNLKR